MTSFARVRFVLEVERQSVCRTWSERFLVQVQAVSVKHAQAMVAFGLEDAESIVSCVAEAPDYSAAA